jgi:hypothetical protein
MLAGGGRTEYPPSRAIRRTASEAAAAEATAAAASDSSYHLEVSGSRRRTSPWQARITHTSTSGATATIRVIWSPTCTHASISPMITGTYQRRGARSSTSQVTSSGTCVPV